jgi:hypothetical protein
MARMNTSLWLMEREARGPRPPVLVGVKGKIRTGTFAYVRVEELVGCGGGSPPQRTRVGRLFRTGRVLKCPRILIARITQGKSRMKVITW